MKSIILKNGTVINLEDVFVDLLLGELNKPTPSRLQAIYDSNANIDELVILIDKNDISAIVNEIKK